MGDINRELYQEESAGDKFLRKAKESPFLVAGLLGCAGTCVLGAYRFKNKGAMSTSVFLMQLRVTAQGIAIGSLTVGMAISFYQSFVMRKKSE